ncbi:hypothetical protein IF2G_02931 [Cordyceps javanica]|nr:hypothetical protein IF2G_02931 [Cordyceps javanica]
MSQPWAAELSQCTTYKQHGGVAGRRDPGRVPLAYSMAGNRMNIASVLGSNQTYAMINRSLNRRFLLKIAPSGA